MTLVSKDTFMKIEEMKTICQKSKDNLEHELGVECIYQDCWTRLQMKGAADNEFKNAEIEETEVEIKEANRKMGEGGVISRLQIVQQKKTSPSRPQAQTKSRLPDILHAIEKTQILLNAAQIS
ncbi:uncharacterized protein Bfra_008107 [Botrytis fragariae]|uniref:Uncharacterized protein n=1 Tax=Botrytis fragariae TaxID=1964551 RepID=A0A8H6AQ75_9HELO|nr:uncharacterized protein Bfra_008107 [Botrytis fragariae]KAF5871587.1 hypothetical protein Bfra_008107 [Botrytis fragariae]